ncbi:P-loop containing nucleoside triphosphate hydrolase protein [Myxozyma melibiosi]|uniref:RNA helicase n=1 Tax=Myxozyma melibiosi TaxID=54550 RepID=A0ABR1EY89_9ASCO
MQQAGVLANLEEKYPGARSMKRKWILHVGPTNSGKTYQALKRLQEAESGIYAGPLRLLAREIYDRMTANGIACDLVTGEDVIRTEDAEGRAARKTSSTVEMVNLDRKFDVAVIDEIQMIADPFRGWAWTNALLGVRAKELHLCGEERTVELLKTLARSLGEEVVVNRYKRLSPLEVEQKSLQGKLQKIRRGDALIAFSRRVIFLMRRRIEQATGLKCAVIYGGLPPETRARQAQLFNDPKSGVDVLVASDAVGMGLNLSVKRIVFESLTKFDGLEDKLLDHNLLKQIAGRAGRFRTATEGTNVKDDAERLGLVTTLEQDDFKYMQKAMQSQPALIRSAGVLPQTATVKEVARTFPASTPFSEILAQFYHEAVSMDRYTLCSLHPQQDVAQMIESVSGLTMNERVTLLTVPVSIRMRNAAKVMAFFANAIANGTPISLVDMPYFELDTIVYADVTKTKTLPELELMNMLTTVYLWLSYVFSILLSTRLRLLTCAL